MDEHLNPLVVLYNSLKRQAIVWLDFANNAYMRGDKAGGDYATRKREEIEHIWDLSLTHVSDEDIDNLSEILNSDDARILTLPDEFHDMS